MGVGTLCQSLQVNSHILLVLELTTINSEIIDGIAVFISLNYGRIFFIVRLHPLHSRLVVLNIMGNGTQTELSISTALSKGFTLTFQ